MYSLQISHFLIEEMWNGLFKLDIQLKEIKQQNLMREVKCEWQV
jgi:hypothetical protein